MPLSRSRRIRCSIVICLLICLITTGCRPPASGSLFSLGSRSSSSSNSSSVENGLPPIGVTRYGALEVTWVKSPVNGQKLFQIAAPTVMNRSSVQVSDQMPVEVRANNIENLLELEVIRFRKSAIARTLNQPLPKKSPDKIKVVISTLKTLTVVQIINPADSRPLTIATVTPADTEFYNKTTEQVATQWKATLQDKMTAIENIYAPQSFHRRIRQTVAIAVAILLLTGLIGFIRWQLEQKQKRLQKRYADEVAATALDTSAVEQEKTETGTNRLDVQTKHRYLTRFLRRQFSLSHQIDLYKFARWVLFWMVVLVWYLGIYLLTTRLPSLMRWSSRVLTQPLGLMAIWFSISLTMRITHFLIQRSLNAWEENPRLSFGDVRRQSQRSQTISGALQGLATCVLFALGILLTLIEFGLPASSIFAGSALLGLALSFGAQSLVKDLVNGCLILIEDQFAVGDVITANGESGLVEQLNLRLTRLRNIDGELISIPNSTITLVKNQSSSWARVNLGVKVAYDTDLDYAITVIEKAATQMSQDAEWQSLVLAPPQVLGIDDFGENSVTIRLMMRTAPSQQWSVARELRRRLKQSLDQAEIAVR